MKGDMLLERLVKICIDEHDMKCELLQCDPPGQGGHGVETCSICKTMQEAYRKTKLYRRIAKEMKSGKRSAVD